MRRVGVAVIAAVLAAPGQAHAGYQESNSGASSDGNSVVVHATEVSTSPGGGGPGGAPTRGGPGVNYQAVYAQLLKTMVMERVDEWARRAAEHHAVGELQARYEHCSATARHYEARIHERVLVVEWVRDVVRVPFPRLVRWTSVHWHRTRVFRRWVSYPHLHHHERWETGWHQFEVWRRVERWETRFNVFAFLQAGVARMCAVSTSASLNRQRHEITERRDGWERMWHDLNRRAHDAWRPWNTDCTTIAEVGDTDIQRCVYPQWRDFGPGSFERQIVVPPVRPPDQVILSARDLVTPDSPLIRMNPRVEWEQIVHLPTWLWVDPSTWEEETARAQAGRAWAEATATPARVVWQMGNGDTVTCAGPGTPYNESRHESTQRTGCSYTYRRSSAGRPSDAYTVTATLVYDVTWHGSGGASGTLGSITRSASVPVQVAEIQALVTDAG